MLANTKTKALMIILLISIAVIATGCGSDKTKSKQAALPLKIYTTIAPLADFTKMIGGKDVVVESLLPPGADAHTFEPTSKEVVQIAKGDGFIYNGLGMESYAEKISNTLAHEDIAIVEASKHVKAMKEEHHDHDAHDHDHGDVDPHIWLDPVKAITMANNIKEALIDIHPEGKQTYEKNFQTLKAKLKKLDKDFQTMAASKHDPKMIVSHAAYGYWQSRYGIEQIPIAGLSPSEEPAQKDLKDIISIARKEQIKYVIFEQNVTPKIAEIIRKEIDAEPLHIHNLAVLTDKEMAEGADYFSLMKQNLETLNKALR